MTERVRAAVETRCGDPAQKLSVFTGSDKDHDCTKGLEDERVQRRDGGVFFVGDRARAVVPGQQHSIEGQRRR